MISRLGVAVMGLCLLLYIVLVGYRAVVLLGSGVPVAVVMGVALLVLPLVGLWALLRELVFGSAAARLGKVLESESGMPDDEVTLLPSGRIVREEADPIVEKYTALAAADDDWRAHYRLGVVQDAAGRRREARASIREAIRREKAVS